LKVIYLRFHVKSDLDEERLIYENPDPGKFDSERFETECTNEFEVCSLNR